MFFPLPAVLKTVLFFGVIFAVVMVLTGSSSPSANLLGPLQGARKNEELREHPLWVATGLDPPFKKSLAFPFGLW